jgi:hypothetical protein
LLDGLGRLAIARSGTTPLIHRTQVHLRKTFEFSRRKLPYFALVGEVCEHPVKRISRCLHYFGVIEVTALQIYRNVKTDGTPFDLKHGANLLALLAFFEDIKCVLV